MKRGLKLPTAKAEGFLQSFQLSPSYDGASLETCKTLKPTNSDAQDAYVSEQTARLSFVVTLTCDLRPFPNAAPPGSQAREERIGMHLSRTVVLLPARPIYRGSQETLLSCQMY